MTVATRQKIDPDAVRRCHADGMTDEVAASVLGCHRGHTGRVRRSLGLPPNKRPVYVARPRADKPPSLLPLGVADCWVRGLDDTRTAAELGVGPKRVGQVRRELELSPRRRVIGWCVGCGEDAYRTALPGPVCDQCHQWAAEIVDRLAYLLDGYDDDDRDDGVPLAITCGRGIHCEGNSRGY